MDEKDEFISEREEKYGGKIRFMSYASLIGTAGDEETPNCGGILFLIDNTFRFEDFEKQATLLTLMGQKQKYTKTELTFSLDQISAVKEVRSKDARNCILGVLDEKKIPPAPGNLFGLFANRDTQVLMYRRPSLFFDILEKEKFISLVNEYLG